MPLAVDGAPDPVGVGRLDLGHVVGDVDGHRAHLGDQILRLEAEVFGQLVEPHARSDGCFWRSCSVSVVSADHDVPWLRETRSIANCRRRRADSDDMSTGCLKARESTPGRKAPSMQSARMKRGPSPPAPW